MRLILLLSCFLLVGAPLAQAQRGGGTAIRGVLVTASRTPGNTDERLKPYEATLRRILRFESFQFVGEGRTSMATPGQASLLIGPGHRLELQTEASDDDRLRVQVNWSERGRSLMRTGLALRRGVPAVLGGPARGEGEVYAVIIVAD